MIASWKHKGLQAFYENGALAGIQPKHAPKLRQRLSMLDTATKPDDLNIPQYRLHKLIGDRKDMWSITVSGNWRITFYFEAGNAYVVNYEDYH